MTIDVAIERELELEEVVPLSWEELAWLAIDEDPKEDDEAEDPKDNEEVFEMFGG